jgi:hypothetical protein
MLRILLIVLLFVACNPYKRVARDNNRTEKERTLIAPVCAAEFPTLPGKLKPGQIAVDSSEYEQTIYDLLMQYSLLQHYYDSLFNNMQHPDSTWSAEQREQYFYDLLMLQRKTDSIRVIKNFLRTYRPAPIYITRTDTITQVDSARVRAYEDRVHAIEAERDRFVGRLGEARQNNEQARKRNRNLWIWLIVLGVGNALQAFLHFKRR